MPDALEVVGEPEHDLSPLEARAPAFRCPGWPRMNRAPDVPLTTVCDLKVELREVSRDFAGAHVNAGSVVGAVRKRIEDSL